MKFLNREALLKKEDLEIVEVDLGKGECIFVRQMTGFERDLFERSIIEMKDDGKVERKTDAFRAKLAVCTVCDDQGKLLFKPADITVLNRSMSAARLEKIVEVAQRLNKITAEDQEELVKNSEGGQTASSTSDSVKN
jgi:hypothetical protein